MFDQPAYAFRTLKVAVAYCVALLVLNDDHRLKPLTSPLLCELPTNALTKLASGLAIWVFPESTTQPVITMKIRIAILKIASD